MTAVIFAYSASVSAQDVADRGSASLSYKGLASAVSQDREYDFQVQAPDGRVLSGPVRLSGVGNYNGGNLGDVDWQVSGSRVTGTLKEGGRQTTTFEGTVGPTKMSGTFTTSDGHTGSWEVDLPAAN
jgi:hypothetical protein